VTGALHLLGVRVDPVSMDEAVERIGTLLRTGPPGSVVTLNGVMLGRAARDERFRRVVNSAALVTPDGVGTMLAARILGMRIPERVAGVDLTDRLCEVCAREGHRVFLFGAEPGVAEHAARRLTARYPGLVIAGTRHGYGDLDDPALAAGISESHPTLLVAALGSPQQEIWLDRWLARTGARAGIGVGGTLDVLAGRSRRAPRWMRELGIEWLYRILRQPRRWRTALSLPGVIVMALAERIRRRGHSHPFDGY
jgi:N-acetylglucosaminyldiphosphoundecaprenol N-acetyl-beta-D-mannosaminyltransferase